MPLHRTNAMTTSMASDEWISARSSCPTAGSPREFVRSVVSRSGVNGASSASGGTIGLAPQDRRQHSSGIEGQIDLSVDRVAHLREQIDQPRDDLRARLGATVLGERLDRTRHDHREVARQAVGRLRVGEGS